MSAIELLADLRRLDIQVFVEGESLQCNAPQGILTEEMRSHIIKYKSQLIALLSPSPPLIPQTNRTCLSFAQQRLWFLDKLIPENPFYNIPAALRLSGKLDYLALKQAFNKIVQRHEALRTNFVEVNGQPIAIASPQIDVSLPVVDLQHLPVTERQAAAQNIATQEAQHPFNLAKELLLRVKLLQLSEDEYVLLLNLHHIVADGWSLGVLIREIGLLYTNQPLPPLAIQYADFAFWQRKYLQGEVLESQLSYWKAQLADLPMLNLPTKPRKGVQSYKGATQNISLSPALSAGLKTLSKQTGSTLFMTMLAAFQVLLSRYTGQEDIVVGSAIANRNRAELEPLIGFFVNSLVLRTDLSNNPTFRELLGRVREKTIEAYDRQDLPFEKLVEELHPERDLSRNPLFQVVFALQNAPMQPLELPGITLNPLQFEVTTTRFDLELHLWEQSYGLSGLWEEKSEGISGFLAYNTDLFDKNTISQFLAHFQTLLTAIVANPDIPIADLPLLSDAESHQLLEEWNQTSCSYSDKLFHQLFEEQAEKSPNAIALVFDNQTLTYQQLNHRANQLAHYLQELGIKPESLVGICVEKSLEMIVGILGIFKAGGAYVPIDPNYPQSRREFMLTDTQVKVVLTQQSLTSLFADIKLICLDTDENIDAYSTENPTSSANLDNLAYIIYTSGSTGQPKGVLIEHRGLCNVVVGQIKAFELRSHNRILQFSSLCFDASIFEILLAFGVGATLYIPPKKAQLPGKDLIEFLQTNAINTTIISPSVLAVLPASKLPLLQTVIAGGEACTTEIVQQWATDRRLFNAYGLTETTIWATTTKLMVSDENPSIGRPVTNTQIYLLSNRLFPVPIGVVGEIYIAGDGIARGYLNQAELTAERFINNPFANNRLYKTGDLALYRHDGSLEFIGRIDEQVKIRGFRIELGEIETVLKQHPMVENAIALVNSDRIIAYIVPQTTVEQQLQLELVLQWENLYNRTYSQSAKESNFNIIGWNSSYTGLPIPTEQMQTWVNSRVEQILALQPERVLEIGCGTGLLLFKIAPHCSEYVATDFSAASIQYLKPLLQPLPQVKLLQQLATDFTGIAANSFDAVILNSVIQYFPSLDYLLQVLEKAIETVTPGGFIFIGDVRNLQLLSAFHAAVQLQHSEGDSSKEQLQQQLQAALFQETELVIDPAFFPALKQRFKKISHVQVQLTRECDRADRNELTQFRYNAILHIESQKTPTPDCQLDWEQDNLSISKVSQYLLENQPAILQVTKIPNSRVITAVKTAQWLTNDTESPQNAHQMREELQQLETSGIEPEDWYKLNKLPYTVEVSWINTDATGCYDVIFQSISQKATPGVIKERHITKTDANNPLQAQLARQIIPQLQHYLQQNLPDYMIPAAFVVLEKIPLTTNGKVNRRALPVPNWGKNAVSPTSPTQQKLANIWAELLGLKNVGIDDNFFQLGGHSLLATQLTSRIRETFGVELPLQKVFETPQIVPLAKTIETLQSSQKTQPDIGIVPLSRDAHRRLRSSLKNPENLGR
ncbi:non-ribosomal peptide synthetase [Synechocystis sp. PCC 7509]|uniref:non-ribosomal peptide synthetase n=1 Tax=Synechocystis sp. PCC 7509 TaxID=927677 RepID=UPI0002ACCCB7|nr:non-ribosomal peptide synthetase [Synechocystis sp. PCC 7509]